MLDDLQTLLAHTPAEASRADYGHAIVAENVLGKSTRKARELALRHLSTLYGLETTNPMFRMLRRLWPLDASAQPLLAVVVALARDPLLRSTQDFVLAQPVGVVVAREAIEVLLSDRYPDRFSAASIQSFAQNVAGTWTAAGLLAGHRRKVRVTPDVRPEVIALLLFLGYLEGRTGQRLFSSDWMGLVSGAVADIEGLTSSASHRGLLVFMNAGGVQEIRFPGCLTPDEERIRQEASHVI